MTVPSLLCLAALTLLGASPPAVDPPAPAPTPSAAPSAPERRAWLGVFLGDALDGGVHLVAVAPGGPAEKAGLRPGDILLQLGDRTVANREAADEVVRSLRAGDRVRVRIVRDGVFEERHLDTAARSIDRSAAPIGSFALEWTHVGRIGEDTGPLGVQWVAVPDTLRIAWGAPAEVGMLVGAVRPDAPAARAGLRVGDIVVSANGSELRSAADLPVIEANRALRLQVVRRGTSTPIQVVVPPSSAVAPAQPEAAARELELLERRRMEREIEQLRDEIRKLKDELRRAKGVH